MQTARIVWLLLLPVLLAAQARMDVRILASDASTVADALKEPSWQPLHARHVNLGFTDKTVWLDVTLHNDEGTPNKTVLDLDNPLLESIELYDENGTLLQRTGMLSVPKTSLHPAFFLVLPPHGTLHRYVRIRNATTTLQFGLQLQPPETFSHQDHRSRETIIGLFGMIAALWLLSVLMYAYTRDGAFALYVLYLTLLVYQQLTYLGFLPLYAPAWFIRFDDLAVVPKVGLMIAAAALYARAFLHTRDFPGLDRIYRGFVALSLVLIPLTGTPWFYVPEAVVFTGFFFILFNTYAGIRVYSTGHKEARFFVLAWLVLIVGYMLMIADALGVVSIMYRIPSTILLFTVIEALLLMLAFVDRFKIYEAQKIAFERQCNRMLVERNETIERRVDERTRQLRHSVEEKETLFKELHHRVKNNLQMILSIIRLQRNRTRTDETARQLESLQNRIRTISQSHEILLENGKIDTVEMQYYLGRLYRVLTEALATDKRQHVFRCTCRIDLPLRQAVYIGLIANELIVNALKYTSAAHIAMGLVRDVNDVVFDIRFPFAAPAESVKGLGMTIVETLAGEQLGAQVRQSDECGIRHISIRFPA